MQRLPQLGRPRGGKKEKSGHGRSSEIVFAVGEKRGGSALFGPYLRRHAPRTARSQEGRQALCGRQRWHSAALGGTRRHSAALGGTRQHSAAMAVTCAACAPSRAQTR